MNKSLEEEMKEYNDILLQEECQIANIEYKIRKEENIIVEKTMILKNNRTLSELVDLSSYPYCIDFISCFKKELFEEIKDINEYNCNQITLTPELIIDKVVIHSAIEVISKVEPEYNRDVEYVATFFFIDGSEISGVHGICPFYCIYNYSKEHKMIMENGEAVRITLL